jgi:hypothetical protein
VVFIQTISRRVRLPGVPGGVEVDAFVFDDVGAFLDLGVDGADVLTEDAEEDELKGGGEEDADEKRCEAEGECLPEGEFEEKIHAGDEEGDGGTDKAGEGGEAQGGTREWLMMPRIPMS